MYNDRQKITKNTTLAVYILYTRTCAVLLTVQFRAKLKNKTNSYCTKSHNVQTRMIFDSIYIEIIARDT